MGCVAAGSTDCWTDLCRSLIRRLENDYCLGFIGHVSNDLAQAVTPLCAFAVMCRADWCNAGNNDEFKMIEKAEINQEGDKISGAKRGT